MKKWDFTHRPYWGEVHMDELLFPTRCMVSANEVKETRVWTDY